MKETLADFIHKVLKCASHAFSLSICMWALKEKIICASCSTKKYFHAALVIMQTQQLLLCLEIHRLSIYIFHL